LVLSQEASTETALFHQRAAAAFGLGISDMKTLSVLLLGGPLTAGQISKRLSLTTGAVTGVIDRLENRGLVHRLHDAQDRRKVVVSVNQQVLAAGPNIYQSMGEAFTRQLRDYTTSDLEFLVRYHEETIELTKREIAKLAKRSGPTA
jgi:DNA-binding MarR family transcriptional regulator